MQVVVHVLGDQFIAYDEQGNEITNREVLEMISFEPAPIFKGTYTIDLPITLDSATDSAIIQNVITHIGDNNGI